MQRDYTSTAGRLLSRNACVRLNPDSSDRCHQHPLLNTKNMRITIFLFVLLFCSSQRIVAQSVVPSSVTNITQSDSTWSVWDPFNFFDCNEIGCLRTTDIDYSWDSLFQTAIRFEFNVCNDTLYFNNKK